MPAKKRHTLFPTYKTIIQRRIKMFENAKWIAKNVYRNWHGPQADEMPPSPYIAKTFELSEKPKSAVLNICALGQGAYYINGKRIPDSYIPTHPSNYEKSVIYNSYDVTDMLERGKNRLGIILGCTRYADLRAGYLFNYPKMICSLDIELHNGEKTSIVSDTSFKVKDSYVLFSYARCGEIHDANLKIDGWCDRDFDDSDWENAKISVGPGGELRPTSCPPRREKARLEGKEIAKGLFDFGINTSGFCNVKIKGKKGDRVQILFDEDLSEDKKSTGRTFRGDKYDNLEMKHRGIYILSGGEDEFEDLFSYHGFQYVQLLGDYEKASVVALTVHTDIEKTSSFDCDNEMINKIYGMCSNSIVTNCQVAMVDCPQREQNEWTGDGMLSAQTVNLCYDAYNMYYEWMLKFKDDQSPDGKLPCIVPAYTNSDLYNGNGLDWSSAIVFIPYYAYKYSGNIKIAEVMWDNMDRMMGYFAKTSMTNLIDTGLGDWAHLDGDKMCPVEITDTVYYRLCAKMMSFLADKLGKKCDKDRYTALSCDIKRDFREKYVKQGKVDSDNFTAIVCAAYSGMLEEKEIVPELSRALSIVKDGNKGFTCGVHGLLAMFDTLTENGFVQELFDLILNPDYPGYARSVSLGYTTIPEIFSHIPSYSRNHQFKCMVNGWFIRYLGGIDVVGDCDINVKPYFVKGIARLEASALGVVVKYDESTFDVESKKAFTLELCGKKQRLDAGKYTFDREKI